MESKPDIFYGYLEEGVYGEFRHVPEPSPNKDKIGFIFGSKRYEFSIRPNYEFKQVSVNPSLTIYQKWIYRVNEGLSETKNKAMENNKPDFESLLDYIDDQYLLNFNKGLIDLNELEKRTRNAIELYIESENKALREENTKCKELSWEAANEILRLKKEIERLEAELKNANSALDNISDMGHA